MVKTKIIATIGPASADYKTLRKMVLSGLDVIRLNFSHGTHKGHLAVVGLMRKINKKYRRHIRIMQDLEGFRIRVGTLKRGPVALKKNSHVFLVPEGTPPGAGCIPIDYQNDLSIIKPGKYVYIDDGNIILYVKNTARRRIKAQVVEEGVLKQRKGINIPGVRFPVSGVTEKDRADIKFGIDNKVDFIAQSFVRRKKDVLDVKDMVKKGHPGCQVVAKIENTEAIRNIDEIIDASDGIMVARGDMGVAVPIYQIPVIQKKIITKCNKKRKFVITATEMLEHMTEHKRPTRAEVTDVANAILDGTDYVMLSAETAAGKHPVEAVDMMNRICKYTEQNR